MSSILRGVDIYTTHAGGRGAPWSSPARRAPLARARARSRPGLKGHTRRTKPNQTSSPPGAMLVRERKRAPCPSSICPALNSARIPPRPAWPRLAPAILDCLRAFAQYHYRARICDALERNLAPAMANCAFHPMPPVKPEILLATPMPSATICGIFILAYLFTIA